MPELPEVEVVRQSLDKKIKQKKVKKVIVRNRNLRFIISHNFNSFLKNQKIIKVDRFSKYLILHLSNNSYCVIHLGMSGTIHYISKNEKNFVTNTSFYNSPVLPKKHNHVEIIFENFKIVYNDPRRFGFFQIINNSQLLKKRFAKYGPEPFQSKFNLNYVFSFFKGKKKNIKNFLIDQNFVSGIGNIYANEILFYSKINPFKKGENISNYEINKILKISKSVLNKAIKKGGSSIRDFKNSKGKKGSYQEEFAVYGREKKNCKSRNCNFKIIKINISNRSTYICNNCQKK